MKSILEDLYYGNINPAEFFQVPLKEYKACQEEHIKTYDSFLQSLEPYQQKTFAEIMEHQFQTLPMEHAAVFSEGFRMGAQMMLEVLQGPPVDEIYPLRSEAAARSLAAASLSLSMLIRGAD